MGDPKNPETFDQIVDLTDIEMIPITDEEADTLTPLHEGAENAVNSILRASTEALKRVGVTSGEVQELADAWVVYRRVKNVQPAVDKLSLMVKQTSKVRGHDVGVLLTTLAGKIRTRADKAPSAGKAAGPFVDLLDYQYGPAQKAAATRAKAKAEAEAEAEAAAEADAEAEAEAEADAEAEVETAEEPEKAAPVKAAKAAPVKAAKVAPVKAAKAVKAAEPETDPS